MGPQKLKKLRNYEVLKNSPNADFENSMSKIWSISKLILEKYPLRPLRRRPQGAAAPWGGGILQNLFVNKPYLAHTIFKIAMGLVYLNFTI